MLIGHATNLGLMRMAKATGISYDILAWTAEWYLREETLAAANAAIVDYHHRLPLTQTFGGGSLSSSDGQRFPVRGKSTTARVAKKWFADRGLSTYTWVSDPFSTYGTKIIVVTTGRRSMSWTRSWATPPTCRSPSTPPTHTA